MNIHIIGGGNLGVATAIGITKYTTNNSVTITRRNISSIQYLESDGIIFHPAILKISKMQI